MNANQIKTSVRNGTLPAEIAGNTDLELLENRLHPRDLQKNRIFTELVHAVDTIAKRYAAERHLEGRTLWPVTVQLSVGEIVYQCEFVQDEKG